MDHRRDAVTDAATTTDKDHFALFSARLAAAGGIAHRAANADEAAETVIRILRESGVPDTRSGARGVAWASSRVAAELPDLIAALEQRGCTVRVPDDPAAVRDQPLGLALARLAIAETGSVLLHEPEITDRAVSLMTNALVAVCPLDALRPSLDDAAAVLREISRDGRSYATLVTGPSRTADIERQLTVGVQGPGEMHVMLVDNLR